MACIAAIGVHTTQYINVILTFRDCSLWARLPVAKCSTHVRHGVHGQRNFVGVHCRLCWRRLAHITRPPHARKPTVAQNLLPPRLLDVELDVAGSQPASYTNSWQALARRAHPLGIVHTSGFATDGSPTLQPWKTCRTPRLPY